MKGRWSSMKNRTIALQLLADVVTERCSRSDEAERPKTMIR